MRRSDNHKRIYRVYCEEKLQVKRRKRRKQARNRGNPWEGAKGLNEVWARDFVSDQLAKDRRIRALGILDVFSRENLLMEVDTSLGGNRVVRSLEKVIELRGCRPKSILSDNGSEFRSKAMIRWCHEWQVEPPFIELGKPSQNGFVEGFNRTFRDTCLNEPLFLSMEEARDLMEEWRIVYNTIKPHRSLNKHTPESFAATQSGVPRTGSQNHQTKKNTPDEVLS